MNILVKLLVAMGDISDSKLVVTSKDSKIVFGLTRHGILGSTYTSDNTGMGNQVSCVGFGFWAKGNMGAEFIRIMQE